MPIDLKILLWHLAFGLSCLGMLLWACYCPVDKKENKDKKNEPM